jgi:mono/diheme cytochrome c family protein
MRTTLGLRHLLATFLLLSVVMVGCGGGREAEPAATGETPAAQAPAPPAPAPAPATAPADPGATVFSQNCSPCHGPQGRGDGPAAKALKPSPRNFHDQSYMATRTDAQLLEVIRKGKGSMPAWGTRLSEEQVAAVLAHIRSLGRTP